jgi:probable rRNA maturation factor
VNVSIVNAGHAGGLGRARLRPWLTRLLADLAPGAGSFSVRLTSDRELRRLNHVYRGQDKATDVLSFAGADGPDGPHLGDVAISVPAARRQARSAGHSLARELRILALHGALHCLGHDHESDDGAMAVVERRYRRRWLDRDV